MGPEVGWREAKGVLKGMEGGYRGEEGVLMGAVGWLNITAVAGVGSKRAVWGWR